MQHFSRAAFMGLVVPILTSSVAFAQSVDLKKLTDVLGTSASPFLLPMDYAEMDQVALSDGTGYTVTLSKVSYAGVEIETVSFDVSAVNDNRVQISNFNFPPSIELGPEYAPVLLSWSKPTLEILYNLSTLAPEGFETQVRDLSLATPDETFSGYLTSLSLSIGFDGTALRTDFKSGKGNIVFEDMFEPITISIPNSELTYAESGYETGQNPLSTTGPQIEWVQSLFSGNMDVTTPTYVIGDRFDLKATIAPIEIIIPSEGLALSYGKISINGQGRHMRDSEASSLEIQTSMNALSTSDSSAGQKIDRLISNFWMNGWDWVALARLYESPVYQKLFANLKHMIESEGVPHELDMFQGIAMADLIQFYTHVFAAMGEIGYDLSMQGFSQEIPGVPGDVGLKSTDVRFVLDLRDPAAGDVEFGFGFAGIDVPEFLVPPELTNFMPSKGSANVILSGLDFEALRTTFADWEQGGGSFDSFDLDAAFLLESWFEGLDLRIEPSILLVTEPTTLSADGLLNVDTNAAYGLTGSVLTKLTSFAMLQQQVADLAHTASPSMQQMFQGAALGLGFLGGFGDLGDDGTLSLDVEVDDNGSLFVNGLPLPF